MYSNIFYFKKICKIGGTEQFLYEIAKKYHKYDITVFFDDGDCNQLYRLRKLVRCIKRKKGELVKCKKAFFNFNSDMIEDVEAERYYFVSHAIYQELGYIPPIDNKKYTDFIGVSNYSARKLEECSIKHFNKKIKAITCYNPLSLEPKEKVINIVSAGRLNDKTKGGKRTIELIKALDRYCEKNNTHYIWHIFTNICNLDIDSPNIAIMKPRIDVRPYIQNADFVAQLSNDMETYCYTVNEALGYGVPVISTPFSVYEELPVNENMIIKMNFDGSNVDEVAKLIFEKKIKKFEYNPPEDGWNEILVKNKSTYEEEMKMKVEVKCIRNFFDLECSCKRKIEETWECEKERADYLVDRKLVEIIEKLEEEKDIDNPKEEVDNLTNNEETVEESTNDDEKAEEETKEEPTEEKVEIENATIEPDSEEKATIKSKATKRK